MSSAPTPTRPIRRRLTGLLPIVAILLGGPLVSFAGATGASLTGGAGYDYYAGPGGQTTRILSGTGAADFGTFSPSLGLARFDDSQAGQGVSVAGSLGAALGTSTWLHSSVTRYIGDSSFRAWRFKLGPSFDLPGGHSFGIYFSHYSDDSSNTSNGVAAEYGVPLRQNLTGRATGSYASAQGQGSGLAMFGLTWSPAHHLELSGDVGVGQSGAGANGAFPSKKAKHNASTATSSNPASAAGEVAVRVTFP
jgi:hypothetical protein